MSILQVCAKYYPDIGGLESHVQNISERLAQKNDVSVLTTDPVGTLPKEEVINGVRVRRFKSWAPNGSYYFSGDLKKFLVKESDEYDIVHAHGYHAFPALYAAQAKGRNKLVFTPHYHGGGHTFFRNLLHKPYKFFGSKIFEMTDRIICVSNYEKTLVMDHFKVEEKKVTVIPNGVHLKEFENLKKRVQNHKTLLYVGRLEKYKGVQFLIKALQKLRSNVIVDIVGKGSYKNTLIKLAMKLGVRNRIRFFSELSRAELIQRYSEADVFLFLSKYEAYGICVAEALASRTPCILANTSALREWVDNECCFAVDYPIKVDTLSKLITEVIGTKVDKVKLWDWEDVVDEVTLVYENLLTETNVGGLDKSTQMCNVSSAGA